MRLVLSPCGTSVPTTSVEPEVRCLLLKHANTVRPDQLPDARLAVIKRHITARGQQVQDAGLEEAQRLSAELNGLLRICGGPPSVEDQILLLCTDTWLGREAGQLVLSWLRGHGAKSARLKPEINDLRTDSLDGFRVAVGDLVTWCGANLPRYRASNYRDGRLQGGFKSIEGLLQTLGLLNADESVYIFESGQEILRLPRLPVKLDIEEHVRSRSTSSCASSCRTARPTLVRSTSSSRGAPLVHRQRTSVTRGRRRRDERVLAF